MKIVSYSVDGRSTYGIVAAGGVIDLGRRTKHSTLREAIANGLDSIDKFSNEEPDHDLDNISFLPPIPDPGMLICMGLNTYSHMEEAKSLTGHAKPPTNPWAFLRSPRSIVGHKQNLIRPNSSPLFDYEGEIALIINRKMRHVPRETALDYIYGYSCFNEGSIRDFQLHSPFYTSGKNFPRSGSFGPWIVTADEINDVKDLELTTSVNGTVLQTMMYDDLIFGFAEILSYVSSFTELHPGDVVVTGAAAGVAAFRDPGTWLSAGDVCEVAVKGIGVLRNTIADAEGSERGPVTCDDPEVAVKRARAALVK